MVVGCCLVFFLGGGGGFSVDFGVGFSVLLSS